MCSLLSTGKTRSVLERFASEPCIYLVGATLGNGGSLDLTKCRDHAERDMTGVAHYATCLILARMLVFKTLRGIVVL